MQTEQYKIGKGMIIWMYKYHFNWVLKVSKPEASLMVFERLFHTFGADTQKASFLERGTSRRM